MRKRILLCMLLCLALVAVVIGLVCAVNSSPSLKPASSYVAAAVAQSSSPRPSPALIRITPRPAVTRKPAKAVVMRRAPTPPPETLAKLTPKPSPTPAPTAFRPLQSGDRGGEVAAVQARLSSLGFLSDSIDGIFGRNTRQAVADFQAANGLSSTGVVDEKTSALLYSPAAFAATPRPTASKKASVSAFSGEEYRDSASKEASYVLNTNTGKFHKPSCQHVKRIKPKNYREYKGKRSDVISMGYVPCKVCRP